MTGRRPLRAFPAAALAFGLALACGGPAIERPELLEIPAPDLSKADPGVQAQLGDRREALEELVADRSTPSDTLADAYGELGLRYIIYDFLEAAEASFDNGRRLAPTEDRWIYLAAYVRQIQGRLDEAVPLYQDVLGRRADFQAARLRLARARLDLGEIDDAASLFQRVLGEDDRSAAAIEGLGRVAAARGESREAVGYFHRALELEPRATSLHYALGQAYRRLGQLDLARRHLADSGDVPVRVPDPYLNPLANLGESIQFSLVQGAEALEDRDYQSAATAYTQAIDEGARGFLAYRGLSYALERLGDVDGAIQTLERALDEAVETDPGRETDERAEAVRILGGLQALAGRDREASETFAQSLELKPAQPGTRMKLANALARQGRLQEALTQYERLVDEVPEHASTLAVARATALINLSRGGEALDLFRRAIEEHPDDARLRARHAEALAFLGQSEAAATERREAERIAREGGSRAGRLADQGRRLVADGKVTEAVAAFEEALSLEPEETAVRYQLAAALGHLGRYDDAESQFRQVLETAPRHLAARRGLIAALLLRGRYGPARAELQEALRRFSLDRNLAHTQARLLATAPDPAVRDGALALELASRLFETGPSLRVRETLALAMAEAGDRPGAITALEALVGEARQAGRNDLVPRLEAEIQALRQGRSWAAASGEDILQAAAEAG